MSCHWLAAWSWLLVRAGLSSQKSSLRSSQRWSCPTLTVSSKKCHVTACTGSVESTEVGRQNRFRDCFVSSTCSQSFPSSPPDRSWCNQICRNATGCGDAARLHSIKTHQNLFFLFSVTHIYTILKRASTKYYQQIKWTKNLSGAECTVVSEVQQPGLMHHLNASLESSCSSEDTASGNKLNLFLGETSSGTLSSLSERWKLKMEGAGSPGHIHGEFQRRRRRETWEHVNQWFHLQTELPPETRRSGFDKFPRWRCSQCISGCATNRHWSSEPRYLKWLSLVRNLIWAFSSFIFITFRFSSMSACEMLILIRVHRNLLNNFPLKIKKLFLSSF